MDPDIETKNKRLAGLILEKTKDYPLLHSSHAMNHAVILAIKERIPQVKEFIQARMVVSPQLSVEKMINNALNEDKVQQVNAFEYVVEEFSIWASKSEVAGKVFNTDGIP